MPSWDGATRVGPMPGERVGSPGLGKVVQFTMNRGYLGSRSVSRVTLVGHGEAKSLGK